MVPPTILRQLARLRWRERCLRLVWGTTLAVAILAGVMGLACLTDWLVDRYQDTPRALRVAMFVGQLVLWGAAGIWLFGWAFRKGLGDDDLALWVEDKSKEFGHRLISALQLNRPGANTRGMSPAMIAAATKQAEQLSAKTNFASLADHSRVDRAGKLGLGLAVVIGILLIFAADTVIALVARQFLADRDIPRSVQLASLADKVWVQPSGEDVVLKFKVRGHHLGADTQGEVTIYPDGAASESYPLVFESALGNGEAIYTAQVRPGTVSYDYRGWLRDGRTRNPSRVRLEPRPAVVKQEAWVRLPTYVGLRPDNQPYEMLQPRGDIVGLVGTSGRVAIQTQKPIKEGKVELLGRPPAELLFALPGPLGDPPGLALGGLVAWLVPLTAALAPDASSPADGVVASAALIPELVLRTVPLKLDASGARGDATFELRPGETAYRVTVRDEFDFVNLDPPRRTIRIDAEEPPAVALLPERFPAPGRASSEDDEVEGVPILHRGKFRVAYTAASPFGLGRAILRYRINEGDWQPLPLKEIRGSEATGPFDPKLGAFVNSRFLDEVEFHRMGSPDPYRFPPGTDGGGRFDFKTAGLNLNVGDKVEFFVEVYDRNPDVNRVAGRSETRMKTVVDLDQFLAWRESVQQEESRIRQLENRQRGVFGSALASEDGPPRSTGGTRRPTPATSPAGRGSFVKSWQVLGPFPNDNDGGGFDRAFPPEQEKTADLGKEYEGLKGKMRWKVHHSPGDKIDLERILTHSEAGVAYAVCWFRADNDANAILATGSDDGIRVWIDRKPVLTKKARREAVPGEDRTPVKLTEDDWHELLVKCDNRTGTWAFYVEFLDPKTGKAIEGLTFRTTPPGQDEKRFVREWQLIGPFPNVGENGRDKPFGPETEPVALDKEYDGIGGKVKWKEHKSEGGRIGFDKFYERPFNESNLAYAVCWVKSDRDRTAMLATGSDDGIKVWVNRKLRIDAAVTREAEPGKDIQAVPLKKGWNEILVKVDNRFGKWAFFLELRDPDTERPLDDLTFSTTPPKEE